MQSAVTRLVGVLTAASVLSACQQTPVAGTTVKNDLLSDQEGGDLSALGLTLKLNQPTIRICFYYNNQAAGLDAEAAAISGISPQAGEVIKVGSSSETAPPPPEPTPSSERFQALFQAAAMQWVTAARSQKAAVVTQAVEMVPVTSPTDCQGDALAIVDAVTARDHVIPAAFPIINLHPRGTGTLVPDGLPIEDSITHVSLHELGHAFGLGDMYVEGVPMCKPGQPSDSVMCELPSRHLTLQPDDIDGIRRAYVQAFESAAFNTEQGKDPAQLIAAHEALRQAEADQTAATAAVRAFIANLIGKVTVPQDKVALQGEIYQKLAKNSGDMFTLSDQIKATKDVQVFKDLYQKFTAMQATNDSLTQQLQSTVDQNIVDQAAAADPSVAASYQDRLAAQKQASDAVAAKSKALFDLAAYSSGVIDPFAPAAAPAG